jgi:hypothetical protein
VIALTAALVLTLDGVSTALAMPQAVASPWLRRAPTLLVAQSEPAAPAQPAPAPGDVDLLPTPAAPDPAQAARQEQLEHELQTRRKMLQLHQLGGMLTLASLGATVIFGELNYLDKYGGGGDTGRWYEWHRWTAFTAAAIFAGTGALAIFAPSPLPKPKRLDTVMLHRIAMGVATAGMVTQIVLGFVTASKGGSISQRDFALAHEIVGFTTFGATAVGFGVLTF